MLLLSTKSLTVDGVTVFPDHADPNQFWYLPAPVTLAKMPGSEEPQFLLILYAPDVKGGGVKGVGFLDVTLALLLSDDTRQSIIGQIRTHFPDADHPLLAPVPFDEGTVQIVALDLQGSGGTSSAAPPGGFTAVEHILGAVTPGLYGDNDAVFALTLSEDGATIMQAAFEHGMAPVGAIYNLKFTGVRPALDVKITADLKRCYESFSIGFDAKAYWVSAGIDATFEKLRQDGALKIEVVNLAGDADSKAAEQQAIGIFKDEILSTWFEPSLNAQTAAAADASTIPNPTQVLGGGASPTGGAASGGIGGAAHPPLGGGSQPAGGGLHPPLGTGGAQPPLGSGIQPAGGGLHPPLGGGVGGALGGAIGGTLQGSGLGGAGGLHPAPPLGSAPPPLGGGVQSAPGAPPMPPRPPAAPGLGAAPGAVPQASLPAGGPPQPGGVAPTQPLASAPSPTAFAPAPPASTPPAAAGPLGGPMPPAGGAPAPGPSPLPPAHPPASAPAPGGPPAAGGVHPPGQQQGAGGANPLGAAVAALPAAAANASSAASPFGVSLKLKYVHQDELKTVTYEYNRMDAVQRTYAPQGYFGLLVDKIDRSKHFLKIDGVDPFFTRFKVVVSPPRDFAGIGLQTAHAALDYGDAALGEQVKHGEFIFDGTSAQPQEFEVFQGAHKETAYRYAADFTFDPDSGWDAEKDRYQLPVVTTENRQLVLDPREHIGFLQVAVTAGRIDADVVDRIDIALTYVGPTGWTSRGGFSVKPGAAPQQWKVRTGELEADDRDGRNNFTYTYVLTTHLKSGAVVTSPPTTTTARAVIVDDPFVGVLDLTVRTALDPAQTKTAMLEVTYDGGPDYSFDTTIELAPGAATTHVLIPLLDRSARTYGYRVTTISTTNQKQALPPVQSQDPLVVVSEAA